MQKREQKCVEKEGDIWNKKGNFNNKKSSTFISTMCISYQRLYVNKVKLEYNLNFINCWQDLIISHFPNLLNEVDDITLKQLFRRFTIGNIGSKSETFCQ